MSFSFSCLPFNKVDVASFPMCALSFVCSVCQMCDSIVTLRTRGKLTGIPLSFPLKPLLTHPFTPFHPQLPCHSSADPTLLLAFPLANSRPNSLVSQRVANLASKRPRLKSKRLSQDRRNTAPATTTLYQQLSKFCLQKPSSSTQCSVDIQSNGICMPSSSTIEPPRRHALSTDGMRMCDRRPLSRTQVSCVGPSLLLTSTDMKFSSAELAVGLKRRTAAQVGKELKPTWLAWDPETRIKNSASAVAELTLHREMKDLSVRNAPIAAFHDARANLDNIQRDVCHACTLPAAY